MYTYKSILAGLVIVAFSAYGNSLIDPSTYNSLTSDRRAFRVGEPVVILIVESTNAQSSAGTATSKDFDINLNATTPDSSYPFGAGVNRKHDGNGKTTRRGTASSTISARVVEILENGLVKIKGTHSLLINKEKQTIVVSGIARINDISRDNTIYSSRLADADIEILGDGAVSESAKRGLFSLLFGWI